MLLTNNGELAQAMLHPRYHVPKTYLIKVKGVLTDEDIRNLEKGVKLDDGMTGPAQVKKVRKVEANSWLEITIREGRKHQVKRMLESVGHPVIKLLRIRMGSLSAATAGRAADDNIETGGNSVPVVPGLGMAIGRDPLAATEMPASKRRETPRRL